MTPSRIEALASALKDLLTDVDTPKQLRDKAVLFAAELRDELPDEQARQVEAIEAEAVILSFGRSSLSPFPQRPSEDTPQKRRRNAPLQLTKSVSNA